MRCCQALRSVMLPAQFNAGSMGCQLYAETNDADSLCYLEQWATKEDVEREIGSTRFGKLLAIIEAAAGSPTLEIHNVSETFGWDYIRMLRNDLDTAGNGNGSRN